MARKQAQKQLKDPTPTIIGAGITEQWYFKHLQTLRKYRVKVRPRYFGRENAFELVKRVDDVLKDQGLAIVVFDADVSQRNDQERQLVERMKSKYANNKAVLLCDSLPSIEYWFLLHYKDVGRPFYTCDEVVRELKKHITQFDKNEKFLKDTDWVKQLCKNGCLTQAIDRAKLQEEKVQKGQDVSYSRVYKALELLEKRKT
ncbi:RloB family protein [Hoylesella loescheii]|uniref:RloB-like protein n=1 Tax=Hoylesella loescheii DSM 19665 = JCM 12249 = ATCC 15930 TaxID=1122985 RepID=A0A069QFP4_HOYLO|nr:RloB family protein [Hoylesella loescheii]KDR51658.1 hypothetical protein HMPREF1991_02268 [Hoylesella loescheii DSM 19665 = JCM 12249 = ATCC 15930]